MKKTILALAVAAAAVTVPARGNDPDERPERGVARISLINGEVSVRRGDSGDWTAAAINAPLVVEDRLLTGPGSRAEVQFDHANMIRVASNSEIRMAELGYRRYIVQLARGLATFRVLRNSDADVEISTPSVAVRAVKRGAYRIHVREDGTTEVAVRSGEVEIFTPRGSQRLSSGRTIRARGTTSDPEYQVVSDIPDDDWDRWNERRDRDLERSRSYNYINSDIYGAEDLDHHGRWMHVPPYGWVWRPYASAGWAPYRLGRWSWIDWYGWTWVSHDPWGWAPYHYGRWFWQTGGWCWWPGGYSSRHYWRPALVGFFGIRAGGFHLGLSFGRVGWAPLAPYEVYRPWYGRNYYNGYRNGNYIDNSVRITNNVNITNIYRNARVDGGYTVVDGNDFRIGRVNHIRNVATEDLGRASLVRGQLPVAPDRQSLRLADREPGLRAERSGDSDRFFGRRQPERVDRVGFDEQRRSLEQVARRTLGDVPTRAVRSEAGRSGESAARGNPGVETGRSDSEASTRRASENEGRGWRPAGEPARGAESSEGRRASEDGGWRRFGEPTRNAERSSESGSVRSTGEDRGWRRVGEADARSSENRDARRSGEDRGGWRRFGEPSAGDSGRSGESEGARRSGSDSPRRAEESFGQRIDPDRGQWRRFEEGAGRSSEGRESSRSSESPGSGRSSDSSRVERRQQEERRSEESIRISPPIVRERGGARSEDGGFGRSRGDSPRFETPRGGGDSSGGRRNDGPRFEQSAPRSGGDFGGRRGGDSSGPRFEGGGSRGGGDFGGRSGGGGRFEGGGGRSGGDSGGGRSGGGGVSGGRSGGGEGRSGGGGRGQ